VSRYSELSNIRAGAWCFRRTPFPAPYLVLLTIETLPHFRAVADICFLDCVISGHVLLLPAIRNLLLSLKQSHTSPRFQPQNRSSRAAIIATVEPSPVSRYFLQSTIRSDISLAYCDIIEHAHIGQNGISANAVTEGGWILDVRCEKG
jgi:hypothetical protein